MRRTRFRRVKPNVTKRVFLFLFCCCCGYGRTRKKIGDNKKDWRQTKRKAGTSVLQNKKKRNEKLRKRKAWSQTPKTNLPCTVERMVTRSPLEQTKGRRSLGRRSKRVECVSEYTRRATGGRTSLVPSFSFIFC